MIEWLKLFMILTKIVNIFFLIYIKWKFYKHDFMIKEWFNDSKTKRFILRRLDDLYTRVLPSLENLTSRVRKVEDRERLAVSEDTQHIQKILDIVEDMKEERK